MGYWPAAPPEGSGSGLGVVQDLSTASERGEGAFQLSPPRANGRPASFAGRSSGRHVVALRDGARVRVAARRGSTAPADTGTARLQGTDQVREAMVKIVDLRVTTIGLSPVLRIVTDAPNIDGVSQARPTATDRPTPTPAAHPGRTRAALTPPCTPQGEVPRNKGFLKPQLIFLRDHLLGHDPTDVERCMRQIRCTPLPDLPRGPAVQLTAAHPPDLRQVGGFKPWGSAISMVEVALWDCAGKAAGVPIHKLLGGKVRDQVRTYDGSLQPLTLPAESPEVMARNIRAKKELPQEFSIIKMGIGPHSDMPGIFEDFSYAYSADDFKSSGRYDQMRGTLTERGFDFIVACVRAMKEVLGDEVGLALDCGPGLVPSDLLRLAQEFEPLHLMWMEDGYTVRCSPFCPPIRRLPCSCLTAVLPAALSGGLHTLRKCGRVPRHHQPHLHANPYRRADLPARELQAADRDACGGRARAGPAGLRRAGGAQVDLRMCATRPEPPLASASSSAALPLLRPCSHQPRPEPRPVPFYLLLLVPVLTPLLLHAGRCGSARDSIRSARRVGRRAGPGRADTGLRNAPTELDRVRVPVGRSRRPRLVLV